MDLSDNERFRYKAVIKKIKKDSAELQVKEKLGIYRKIPELFLLQCILKKEAMEFSIQKTVEIGVDSIVPVLSERVVAGPSKEKIQKKISRWQQISIAASKQCKRDFICNIGNPIELKKIDVKGYGLFLSPVENDAPIDDCAHPFLPLKDILEKGSLRKYKSIAYIIGPEGGFSEREKQYLKEKGSKLINFGKNILRSETSSVYFLSILDYLIKTSIGQ